MKFVTIGILFLINVWAASTSLTSAVAGGLTFSVAVILAAWREKEDYA